MGGGAGAGGSLSGTQEICEHLPKQQRACTRTCTHTRVRTRSKPVEQRRTAPVACSECGSPGLPSPRTTLVEPHGFPQPGPDLQLHRDGKCEFLGSRPPLAPSPPPTRRGGDAAGVRLREPAGHGVQAQSRRKRLQWPRSRCKRVSCVKRGGKKHGREECGEGAPVPRAHSHLGRPNGEGPLRPTPRVHGRPGPLAQADRVRAGGGAGKGWDAQGPDGGGGCGSPRR